MNVFSMMSDAVRAWQQNDLKSAEQMFRSVCYSSSASQAVRRDALRFLCCCMDQRNLWHESESEAMRVERHWQAEEARRRSQRNTLATVACGVGLFCLFVVSSGRPRSHAFAA